LNPEQQELIDQYLSLDPEGEYFLQNNIGWSDTLEQPVSLVTISGVKNLEKLLGERDSVPSQDNNFVFEPKWLRTFKMCFESGKNMMLVGPSGNGKTQFMKQICNRLNRPFFSSVFHEDFRAADFFGKEVIYDGNKMKWNDGPGTAAWSTSGALVFLDEVDRAPAGVLARLHEYLEEKTTDLAILEKDGGVDTFKKAKGVQITAAGNVLCNTTQAMTYTSAQRMDEAFISRFAYGLETTYPSAEVEKKVILTYLKDKLSPDKWNEAVKAKIADTVDKMVQVASEIRSMIISGKLQISLSMRDTQNWAYAFQSMGDLSVSTHVSLIEIRDSATAEVIDNTAAQIFGPSYVRYIERPTA
jgi:MoxR-like ATPase